MRDNIYKDINKIDTEVSLLKQYETQVKENPNSELYIKIGYCYAKLSFFERALVSYHEAHILEANPETQVFIFQKMLFILDLRDVPIMGTEMAEFNLGEDIV